MHQDDQGGLGSCGRGAGRVPPRRWWPVVVGAACSPFPISAPAWPPGADPAAPRPVHGECRCGRGSSLCLRAGPPLATRLASLGASADRSLSSVVPLDDQAGSPAGSELSDLVPHPPSPSRGNDVNHGRTVCSPLLLAAYFRAGRCLGQPGKAVSRVDGKEQHGDRFRALRD